VKYRDVPDTEKAFRAQVLQLATRSGWLVYPAPDVPGSLILCRPPALLFVGVKSETGKLRHEQREWLEALARCESVEVVLWRPSDWEEIAARLEWRDEDLGRSPPGTPFTELSPQEKRARYKENARRRKEGRAR
jgi:hypothetical protein